MYFVKSSEFGYNDVDDDFVVFNLITGSYSLLNSTSKEIWLFIKNNCKVKFEEIIDYLLNIFDVDREELNNDVDSDFVVFNLIAGSYSLPRNEISFL